MRYVTDALDHPKRDFRPDLVPPERAISRIESRLVITEKVFEWWDYPIFGALSILGVLAILSLLAHWFSVQDWIAHPVSFSLMTLILLVILANNQGRWFLLPYMRQPGRVMPGPGWKVAVVTTFVPSAEPVEMLEQTVKALVRLDYPHDTWVLDEEDDEQVRALCQRLGARHFSRKPFYHYQSTEGTFQSRSKHGNYNAWLNEIGFDNYEILTMFDPDHVPQSNFLSRVLGYFDDPKIAYVQLPQAYYNQTASFIARGAAEETYAYYSSVQMAACGMGYPVIVGCHNSHRIAALKPIGGFPAHDAEDLLLTLAYRAHAWQGVYVPEILARGLTPVDWSGYLQQQRRWARSVVDIKFRRYFCLSKSLPLKTRVISFLHGLNYLHRSVMMFLAIMLTTVMLATGITPDVVSYVTMEKLGTVCVVLQICELYRQRFYLDWRNEWGSHWRVALLQYAKWPWFLLALVDVLLGKRKPYVLTSKMKSNSRKRLLLLPNLLVAILICGAWVIGQMGDHSIHPLVYVSAAIYLTASCFLIWTEFRQFPPPYEHAIRDSSVLGRDYSCNLKMRNVEP
jgi:cellulose synthase/poly-beta-1,6-N-acetylglucosamine synthase-like glycosyltransferase